MKLSWPPRVKYSPRAFFFDFEARGHCWPSKKSGTAWVKTRYVGGSVPDILDQDNAVTMPITSSAAQGSTATPHRRWWLFKEAYEHGELFETALGSLTANDPLWQMHP